MTEHKWRYWYESQNAKERWRVVYVCRHCKIEAEIEKNFHISYYQIDWHCGKYFYDTGWGIPSNVGQHCNNEHLMQLLLK